jgi:hypothetical protein
VPIEQEDARVRAVERARTRQTAEASADDHDTMRIRHASILMVRGSGDLIHVHAHLEGCLLLSNPRSSLEEHEQHEDRGCDGESY